MVGKAADPSVYCNEVLLKTSVEYIADACRYHLIVDYKGNRYVVCKNGKTEAFYLAPIHLIGKTQCGFTKCKNVWCRYKHTSDDGRFNRFTLTEIMKVHTFHVSAPDHCNGQTNHVEAEFGPMESLNGQGTTFSLFDNQPVKARAFSDIQVLQEKLSVVVEMTKVITQTLEQIQGEYH